MRVPACAMFALFVLGACATPDSQPSAAGEGCDRAQARAAIDPEAGTWQLVAPTHADNEFGVAPLVSELVDGCDQFVSLSHSLGQGGKAASPGRSELLVSTNGGAWLKRSFNLDNAFRDIARGGGKWVAVGHGTSSPGAIAVTDSLDDGTWREVFQSDGFYFNRVAYGANTFVAVTTNGVATSRDGEHWRWAGVPSQALYFDVAFGGGHFVVAGVGATLSSSDGESWRMMRCEDDVMCKPHQPPPAADMSSEQPDADQLALQVARYVGGKFYAFGASGRLESADAQTFQRTPVIPEAAMGGLLLQLPRSPSETLPARLLASADDWASFLELPYEQVDSVDCRKVTCVALPLGILAFVPH